MRIHIEIICNSFSLSPCGHVCLEASPFSLLSQGTALSPLLTHSVLQVAI